MNDNLRIEENTIYEVDLDCLKKSGRCLKDIGIIEEMDLKSLSEKIISVQDYNPSE